MNRNCEKCDFNHMCLMKDADHCSFDDPKVIFGEPIESNENKLIKLVCLKELSQSLNRKEKKMEKSKRCPVRLTKKKEANSGGN